VAVGGRKGPPALLEVLLLSDNDAGKPESIHPMIGRCPVAAFGNSTGDQQMLEYTKAGDGARLSMQNLAGPWGIFRDNMLLFCNCWKSLLF
jgi:hypothetical protein